jgi:hypothetical protein
LIELGAAADTAAGRSVGDESPNDPFLFCPGPRYLQRK